MCRFVAIEGTLRVEGKEMMAHCLKLTKQPHTAA